MVDQNDNFGGYRRCFVFHLKMYLEKKLLQF